MKTIVALCLPYIVTSPANWSTAPGWTPAKMDGLVTYAIELTGATKCSEVLAYLFGNLNECKAELSATITQMNQIIP